MKQFTYESIHDCMEPDGVMSPETAAFFTASMISTCGPVFNDCDCNRDVAYKLKKANIITDDDDEDSESCQMWVSWEGPSYMDRAKAFIDRLNAYIKQWHADTPKSDY